MPEASSAIGSTAGTALSSVPDQALGSFVVTHGLPFGALPSGAVLYNEPVSIALPTARIAVMGPEAAVNAVYANKIAAIESEPEREAFVAQQRAEFEADVDILRLASELVVDAIVRPEDLRDEIVARLAAAEGKDRSFSDRRHGVPPV